MSLAAELELEHIMSPWILERLAPKVSIKKEEIMHFKLSVVGLSSSVFRDN